MLRVVDQRTFVLVEGPSDAQALDPQIDSQTAITFPAYSKPKAVKALEAAEDRGMERVIAIVDLDWDGLLHPMQESRNLVYTEDCDLDATVLLAGDILDRIVSNYSSRELRERFLSEHKVGVEELVLDIASTIGVLRYISESNGHGIRCRDFPIHAVLSETCREVDLTLLAKIAVRRSPDASIAEQALAVSVRKTSAEVNEKRRFSNGHDIAAALAALLRHWGGSASRESVERAARSSFGCPELKETALFARVKEWATREDTHVWSCS
jgi:hypothetical protein